MKKFLVSALSFILIFSSLQVVHASKEAISPWAASSVQFLQDKNAVQPELVSNWKQPITRKEFATLIVKVLEARQKTTLNTAGSPFTDTKDVNITKAYNAKIVNGIGNGLFQPDGNITREQIAIMFVNALMTLDTLEAGKEHIVFAATDPNFVDNGSISSWAKPSVYLAYNNQIISGVGGGRMDPKSSATREQAMVIAARVWQNLDKPTFIPDLKNLHARKLVNTRTEFDNVISGKTNLALKYENMFGMTKVVAEGFLGTSSSSSKLVSFIGHDYYTYNTNGLSLHFDVSGEVIGITIPEWSDRSKGNFTGLGTEIDPKTRTFPNSIERKEIKGVWSFVIVKTSTHTFEFTYKNDTYQGVTIYEGDFFNELVFANQ